MYRDVLVRAKELIEKYGWIKGNVGNRDIGYCAIGAIVRAQNEQPWSSYGLYSALADEVRRLTNGERETISSYNDFVAKSKEDIFALFDAVIEKEPVGTT